MGFIIAQKALYKSIYKHRKATSSEAAFVVISTLFEKQLKVFEVLRNFFKKFLSRAWDGVPISYLLLCLVAAATAAAVASATSVVGAEHDEQSDKDDPEALIIKKITDAVHISHFHSPYGGESFLCHIYRALPERGFVCRSDIII